MPRNKKSLIQEKTQELRTLCEVEMVFINYSPYSDEPKVFPNHGGKIKTFQNFKELAMSEISKNMVTRDEFTEERIKKLEKNLLKIKKENRVKEITNEMHEVLNGKTIS
ncbi:hypothetical protein H5410_030692 [Solanum commersonii]|uniref:MADS-box domain-containing protein n=1 Tax=Solanum commersonii TaxID=4109 RepID=A0A9J5YGC4_SOLCO|nr:hypothetical protein H5410_030692 [Solanum commersonii]